MKTLLIGVAAVVVSTSVASAQEPAAGPSLSADEANPQLMAGLVKSTIRVGDLDRIYFVHVPKGLHGPAPVLFELHGGRGTAPRRSAQTGFNEIADRERFIAVYPQGYGYRWNDGRQRADATGPQADDVAFFQAMMEKLVSSGVADPKRIYVVGGSNGGMMTHRLACELSERLAAVTAIVSSMAEPLARVCNPKRPVPILMMNGTADPLVLFDGGIVSKQPGNGRTIPVMQTVEFWRRIDGCSDKAKTSMIPDRDPSDGMRTEVFVWSDCKPASQVVFFKMNGAGHGLPGRSKVKPRDAELRGGKSTNDFDSSDEAWKFMRQFKLP